MKNSLSLILIASSFTLQSFSHTAFSRSGDSSTIIFSKPTKPNIPSTNNLPSLPIITIINEQVGNKKEEYEQKKEDVTTKLEPLQDQKTEQNNANNQDGRQETQGLPFWHKIPFEIRNFLSDTKQAKRQENREKLESIEELRDNQ